jgi:pyridoxine 4-dehydrogenase
VCGHGTQAGEFAAVDLLDQGVAGREVAVERADAAMQLAHGDPADAVRVLRRAIELGVDHIDTAQFYGTVNDLIRTALRPYPARLRIVTKVGAVVHG